MRSERTLWGRWAFLRGLGLVFVAAFASLLTQVRGLSGPDGVLPVRDLLKAAADELPLAQRLFEVPTLLWLGAGDGALLALCAAGTACGLLLALNVAPRISAAACTILFLSWVSVAQDFSSYQSDSMLLEAGLLAVFLAPGGLRPGLAEGQPVNAIALWLLRWEWFRIYFQSGVVKLLSGDVQWRGLTALDHYYEYLPLPTAAGYWVQQLLPHGVHAATTAAVLLLELVAPLFLFVSPRTRKWLFVVTTPFQLGIIATANYGFLNCIVIALGLALPDDHFYLRGREGVAIAAPEPPRRGSLRSRLGTVGRTFAALYVFATLTVFPGAPTRELPAWALLPARLFTPFRVANHYGLFAVMTTTRDELEFQGSRDGKEWLAYPFRYKPQDVSEAPRFYVPHQPRLDWNLWFAALGEPGQYPWVIQLSVRLLQGSKPVASLFARDPFAGEPPAQVRVVRWSYRFATLAEHRATGAYWVRESRGLYGPALRRRADGKVEVTPAE